MDKPCFDLIDELVTKITTKAYSEGVNSKKEAKELLELLKKMKKLQSKDWAKGMEELKEIGKKLKKMTQQAKREALN